MIKAPKKYVKEKNRNKEGENETELKTIYQIIPWEYFDFYEVKKNNKNKNSSFSFFAGDEEVTVFSDERVYEFFQQYKSKIEEYNTIVESLSEAFANTTIHTLDLENTAFNAAFGMDQSKTGHGIYAEKAGVILDRINGEESTHVGSDNAINGPDKIVGNKAVQCKYCKTPGSSVGNCLKKNPITGQRMYRYFDLNGNPMQVEVPKDQYEKAVENFAKRISNGEVKGVTNPEDAKKIIRKGRLTYQQAKNLAKAGTFESITYDISTGIISCSAMCGISALVSFGVTYWSTKDKKKAAKAAFYTGIEVFGSAFMGHILAAQIARTSFSNLLKPVANEISKRLSYTFIQNVVNAFRIIAGKPQIYGAAAQKSFAKALRTNALTQGIMFIVFSVPDTYRVINKKVSGAQYSKNMVSSLMGILGVASGSAGAGYVMGKIGGKIDGNVGKVIGASAGVVMGVVASMMSKKIGDFIIEDDVVITARMFNSAVANTCIDYLIDEAELDMLIEKLNGETKKIFKLQRLLIASEHQYNDIVDFLNPFFDEIVSNREHISNKMLENMYDEFDAEIEEFCMEVINNEV